MLRSIVLLSLPFVVGCSAHAHAAGPVTTRAAVHSHNTIHTAPVVVEVSWVWVAPKSHRGHARTSGHWSHPHYGKSYRAHAAGPPPHRPHAQAHWAAGHWEGHGRNRHWVAGRWK